MAPVQVIPVPVVMCNVFGQQVFPAMAFPGMKAQVGMVPQQQLLQQPQQQQQPPQQFQQQLMQQQQQQPQLPQQQLPQQQQMPQQQQQMPQQQQLLNQQQQLPQQQLPQQQQLLNQQQQLPQQQQLLNQQQQLPQQQQQLLNQQQQLPQQQQQQQQLLNQQQMPQHQQPLQPPSPQQQPMRQQMLQVQPFPQAWAVPESWRAQEWQAPEPEDEPSRPLLSTSARRRLRRQRAALRRPASLELQSEGQATPPPPAEVSTPSSESAGEHPSCDDLPEGSEGGSEAPHQVPVTDILGSVARLSFDRQGCRIVQEVIAQAEKPLAAKLVAELHGRVREAMASPHANYVLQTVITALPLCLSGFVIKELLGFGAPAARHRFGCRILCRLIEHAGSRPELAPLLGEVIAEAEDFCRHPFAHHVVECAVEHVPERRREIAQALCVSAKGNACHRCASHVVEAALLHCDEEEKEQIVTSLRGSGGMSMLARNQFGCYVVKAVLRLPSHLSEEARSEVVNDAALISTSRYGHRLLKDLGMTASPSSNSC